MSLLIRRTMNKKNLQQPITYTYVDLGLPSGILWATTNIGARNPEDAGDYYSWGEINTKSSNIEGNYLVSNITTSLSTIYNDVAMYLTNSEYRMPTKYEFEELLDRCNWEWIEINGMYGFKGTSKINNNTIFFPAAGKKIYYPVDINVYGYYWTSTFYNSTHAEAFDFAFDDGSTFFRERYLGFSIRPVKKIDYIDLGLPSGTLWAKTNLGAVTQEEIGRYFAWGETSTKGKYDTTNYKFGTLNNLTKYCTNSSYGTVDNNTLLLSVDDVATIIMGTLWHIPTHELVLELYEYCNVSQYGNGYTFQSKINGNIIFIPNGGYKDKSGINNSSYMYFWTADMSDDYNNNYAYSAYCNASIQMYSTTYSLRTNGLPIRAVTHK